MIRSLYSICGEVIISTSIKEQYYTAVLQYPYEIYDDESRDRVSKRLERGSYWRSLRAAWAFSSARRALLPA